MCDKDTGTVRSLIRPVRQIAGMVRASGDVALWSSNAYCDWLVLGGVMRCWCFGDFIGLGLIHIYTVWFLVFVLIV